MNIVLTTWTGGVEPGFDRFCRSLSAVVPNAHLGILTRPCDASGLDRYLRSIRSNFSLYPSLGLEWGRLFFQKRFRTYEFVSRTLGGIGSFPSVGRITSPAFLNLCCARFVLYERILKRLRWDDLVVVSDSRDVIFTGDPFAHCDQLVSLSEEDRLLLDGEINELWFRALMGREMDPERWRNLPVICAGVVLASVEAMLRFLNQLVNSLLTHWRRMGAQPWDQAALNLLIRTNSGGHARVFSRGEGPILHASNRWKQFVTLDGNQIRWNTGEVISIVHQYDRFDDLNASMTDFLARRAAYSAPE